MCWTKKSPSKIIFTCNTSREETPLSCLIMQGADKLTTSAFWKKSCSSIATDINKFSVQKCRNEAPHLDTCLSYSKFYTHSLKSYFRWVICNIILYVIDFPLGISDLEVCGARKVNHIPFRGYHIVRLDFGIVTTLTVKTYAI